MVDDGAAGQEKNLAIAQAELIGDLWLSRAIRMPLTNLQLILWGAAVLLYGVGDTTATALAVQYEHIEEATPATRRLLGANPSLWGLTALKIVAFTVFVGGYLLLESNRYRDLAPIALALLGAYAVLNNGIAIVRERRIQ